MKRRSKIISAGYAVSVLSAALSVSSCKQGAPRAAVRAEHSLSDLDQNGFITTGWSVSEDDSDVDSLPSKVFARANADLRRRVGDLFPDVVSYQTQCLIVPDIGGYRIVALSRKRLTEKESETIRLAARDALSKARGWHVLEVPKK